MGRKRYNPEQIINMLRAVEVLLHKRFKITDVCRKQDISVQTYCRGRKGVQRYERGAG